jgi:hypothetical protein
MLLWKAGIWSLALAGALLAYSSNTFGLYTDDAVLERMQHMCLLRPEVTTKVSLVRESNEMSSHPELE